MQRIVVLIVITAVLLGGQQWAIAQTGRCQNPSVGRVVDEIKARPNLGIEYTQVASFKLASLT